MNKTAIILGATGATGNELLNLLLNDDRYGKIKLFSRHSVGCEHEKIEEYLTDMYSLHTMKKHFTGDEVYCCIGVQRLDAPDEHTCMKAHYHIPVTASIIAKKNGIETFVVVSSFTADIDAGGYYSRIKGEMEYDVIGMHIPHTFVMQPLAIKARRPKRHKREFVFTNMMRFINPFLLGAAAKFRCFNTGRLAKAMIWLANNPTDELFIKGDKILEYCREEEAYDLQMGNLALNGF